MTIPEEISLKSSSNKTIIFHIFEYTSKCSKHGILPLKDANKCSKCKKLKSNYKRGKIYTNKGLSLIE